MTRERTLRQYWCAIAELLHIGPREQDLLTAIEFDEAVTYIKQRTEKNGHQSA